jgi:hypothetical protein
LDRLGAASLSVDDPVCGMKVDGRAFVEIDIGFLGKAVLEHNEAGAGIQDEGGAVIVDDSGHFDDAAGTCGRKSFDAAACRRSAAAFGGVVGKHGLGLARLVPRRIERDPPFDRQHRVAELTELLVVAGHVVVTDAADAVFVAEQLKRRDVVVDRALERFAAVAGKPAQKVAIVVERFELDQTRGVFSAVVKSEIFSSTLTAPRSAGAWPPHCEEKLTCAIADSRR